jgi:CubicO group peptidase (beta-lactamase class C family)
MTPPIALPVGDPGELGFIPERLEKLRLRLDSYVSEGHYAGISTLIARDGRIAHFSAHGYRDLENALPMDRETIVRIYSMTKVVVSVAALMLLEEGSTDVLGRVIEVITGKRLDEFLAERIFRPLEMNDTVYAVPASKRDRLATAYHETATNRLERITNFSKHEDEPGVKRYPQGGVGLFSTVDDYAKFALSQFHSRVRLWTRSGNSR